MEAAAAEFGAHRAAVVKEETKAPEEAKETSHAYGVDPVQASDLGETKEQREEDVRHQINEDDEEEDEEEGLC